MPLLDAGLMYRSDVQVPVQVCIGYQLIMNKRQ